VRGVFDAAMSVYLDRFLNVPAAPLPEPRQAAQDPEGLLDELDTLLAVQQRVNEAGELVALYLYSRGDAERLLARLGHLLLREDRNFHTIQTVEAALRQYQLLRDTPAGTHMLSPPLATWQPTRRPRAPRARPTASPTGSIAVSASLRTRAGVAHS
jgi:hypothetical protein